MCQLLHTFHGVLHLLHDSPGMSGVKYTICHGKSAVDATKVSEKGHMWLHCCDMLSCPDLRLKTASSSSWGGSPMSHLARNTCFFLFACLFVRMLSAGKELSQDVEKAKPASIANLLSGAKVFGSEVDVSVQKYATWPPILKVHFKVYQIMTSIIPWNPITT